VVQTRQAWTCCSGSTGRQPSRRTTHVRTSTERRARCPAGPCQAARGATLQGMVPPCAPLPCLATSSAQTTRAARPALAAASLQVRVAAGPCVFAAAHTLSTPVCFHRHTCRAGGRATSCQQCGAGLTTKGPAASACVAGQRKGASPRRGGCHVRAWDRAPPPSTATECVSLVSRRRQEGACGRCVPLLSLHQQHVLSVNLQRQHRCGGSKLDGRPKLQLPRPRQPAADCVVL
jgi:hypothetical protein